VQSFLDGLVRSTKTVMTRVELGGTLFLVAVVGVLLTSREEGVKSPSATCAPEADRAAMGAAGAVRLRALRSGGKIEEIVEEVR